jgi:selenium metabolism protein YedF
MKTTILLNSKSLGHGSEELGEKLMGNFLRKLWSSDLKPNTIIFYNSAVKLLIKDGSVLDVLEGLSRSGVDLIGCGTCVEYYKLNEKIVVGRVSDMQEIVSIIMKSKKVITL